MTPPPSTNPSPLLIRLLTANLVLLVFLVLLVTTLFFHDRDPLTASRVEGEGGKTMVDRWGQPYFIRHTFGGCYSVELVPGGPLSFPVAQATVPSKP